MISLAIVDDHAIVRQGLRSVLEREPEIRVVGEAATPDEAMDVVGRSQPRIVLLDLKLSPAADTEGLQLCARLRAAYPDTGILVLTTFLDGNLIMSAIHNGANGYVVKDVDTSELVRSIRAVSRGESAFDSRSAAAMVRTMNGPTGPARFTDREREVLALLARGLSNKAIGQRLYISETTAKFHVGNIMKKLDVSRRAEAVYEASKLGIV